MKHTIIIKWSDEDQVYLANIPELDATTHGDSREEALAMALELIDLINGCDKSN